MCMVYMSDYIIFIISLMYVKETILSNTQNLLYNYIISCTKKCKSYQHLSYNNIVFIYRISEYINIKLKTFL